MQAIEAAIRKALGVTLGAVLLSMALMSTAPAQQNGSAAAPPLHLTADSGELDNAEGVSVYRGNVVVTRAKMRITGDVLRVYRASNGGLDRIEVEGSPATFHDEPEDSPDPVDAEAPRMTYHAASPERIDLAGGAVLHRGRDEFRGEQVRYNIAADRIEADSSDRQRVEITLYPSADEGDDGQ